MQSKLQKTACSRESSYLFYVFIFFCIFIFFPIFNHLTVTQCSRKLLGLIGTVCPDNTTRTSTTYISPCYAIIFLKRILERLPLNNSRAIAGSLSETKRYNLDLPQNATISSSIVHYDVCWFKSFSVDFSPLDLTLFLVACLLACC